MGVITGLIISLADVALVEQISLLAFAGLLAGLMKEANRLGSSMGMLMGSAILILYVGDKQSILLTSIETMIAIGLFLVTPGSLLKHISRFIPGTEENQRSQYEYMRRVRDVTVGKVMKFSTLFEHIADSFKQVSLHNNKEITSNLLDMDEFMARITEKTCQMCWKKEKCWANADESEKTVRMLSEVVYQMDTHGEIIRNQIKGKEYHNNCVNKDKLERVI